MFCLLFVFPAHPATASSETIAVEVNGRTVSRAELEHQVDREFRRLMSMAQVPTTGVLTSQQTLLRNKVEREIAAKITIRLLMLTAAEAARMEITDAMLTERWAAIAASYGGDKGLLDALRAAGNTREKFLEQQREEMMIDAYIAKQVQGILIPRSAARDFYDSNPKQFLVPELSRTSQILIRKRSDARDRIENIKLLLAEGEDMAELAREFSEDKKSAPSGGNIGFFARNQLYPQYASLAFSLPIGTISEPVETEVGWHIIRVDERTPERIIPFEEAEERILQILMKRAQNERMDGIIQKLTDTAEIRVHVDQK